MLPAPQGIAPTAGRRTACLRGRFAKTRVASHSMASDMLCCSDGTSGHNYGRTAGPGPGAAPPPKRPCGAARAGAR
jgi:hypothetical protein